MIQGLVALVRRDGLSVRTTRTWRVAANFPELLNELAQHTKGACDRKFVASAMYPESSYFRDDHRGYNRSLPTEVSRPILTGLRYTFLPTHCLLNMVGRWSHNMCG